MTAEHTDRAAACHCGDPALITVGLRARSSTWGDVDRYAYCLAHLDDALLAIERIRIELAAGHAR